MDLVAALSPDRSSSRPHARRAWARPPHTAWAIIVLVLSLAAAPADSPPSRDGDSQAQARLVANSGGSTGVDRTLAAPAGPEADPIARARQAIAESRARFRSIQDYSCTFYKRERIDGKLSEMNIMTLKARTHPRSVYFKFIQPYEGREAIWVEGKNKGKLVAHESGLTKLVAGTLHLDPRGEMAMEANRHPITEAGIGTLIDTISARWESGLTPGVSRVVFHPGTKVGPRTCTMIETIHSPIERCDFSRVCLYIDAELGIPIRFEGYGWPKKIGQERELMEEYTYMNIRVNSGLKDRDFDPNNAQYSYGRF